MSHAYTVAGTWILIGFVSMGGTLSAVFLFIKCLKTGKLMYTYAVDRCASKTGIELEGRK